MFTSRELLNNRAICIVASSMDEFDMYNAILINKDSPQLSEILLYNAKKDVAEQYALDYNNSTDLNN